MASNILSSSPTQIQYFVDSSLPAKQVLSVTTLSGAAQTGAQLILSETVPAPVSIPAVGLLPNPAPLARTAGFMITDVIVRNVSAVTGTSPSATVLAGLPGSQVAATAAVANSGAAGAVAIGSGGVATNAVVPQNGIITVNETGHTGGSRQYIVMGVVVAL